MVRRLSLGLVSLGGLAALGGCAEQASLTFDAQPTLAPQPADFPLDYALSDVQGPPLVVSVPALEAGTTVSIDVSGANPGDQVFVVGGTGVGAALCPGPLGGQCINLTSPTLVGAFTANAMGDGEVDFAVPAGVAPGTPLSFQAVVVAGAASYVSTPTGGQVVLPSVCTYASYDFLPQSPTGAMADPFYYSFGFYGIIEDGQVYDYDDTLGLAYNAAMVFTFYDAIGQLMCTVSYDMETATSINPASWTTPSGQELYSAMLLDLSDGYTDCGLVDPAVFGTSDLRAFIETMQWGVGLGQMVDMSTDLKDAVNAAGLDWTNDWEPYVYAGYIWTGSLAIESSYAFNFERDCSTLTLDSTGLAVVTDPATTVGGVDDFVSNNPFYLFQIF